MPPDEWTGEAAHLRAAFPVLVLVLVSLPSATAGPEDLIDEMKLREFDIEPVLDLDCIATTSDDATCEAGFVICDEDGACERYSVTVDTKPKTVVCLPYVHPDADEWSLLGINPNADSGPCPTSVPLDNPLKTADTGGN